ncbi:Response regulator of the competence regulonComE [Lactiplantibacillus plantarum]|uniref:DNA-binding response regulator n=1 Tax=Lactiplantibacillus argentoratensis TaxID=271881 RepID=A0AAN1UHW9_9LACO|nr:response regulator transcription factor [Lactiplantibacillus argentoratensis]KZT89165.1 Response regulator of the competence regulonComE [Lactiplantibacillus plantarum]AYJ35235.1 DNA-binding response regulator [Lactiplantibacillus argentoratensis]KRL92730.1 response regulator [Lactiplantibacillus argentoratensis DSM 16365]KZU13727.1 Response regulator of the competence regulonComE [Lactiplantibacillus plantarum]MCA5599598.1 response regulator transcription factor [Lactiplantibacillus argent
MLKTFVVEDDPEQLATLKQIIKNHIMINDFDMELTLATGQAQALLDYVETNPNLDGLYFLDIEYPGQDLNGLALATRIREVDVNARIVFVSTHSEMAFLTFERRIEPLDFIVKDLGQETVKAKVETDIRVAYERYTKHGVTSKAMFSYSKGGQLFNVPLNQVLFIETGAVRNKLVLHLTDRIVQYNGKISDETVAHPELFRIHKSFLVNPQMLVRIDKQHQLGYFENGESVDIAIRKMHDLVTLVKRSELAVTFS